EGAAVAHVCQLFGVEFVELRALVNVLGNRDPSTWAWPDANQGLIRAARWIQKGSMEYCG
ncbi:hypothetical protein HOF92_03740, partial [bacterium]|nr:hypothetical protein [bacterium]